MMSKHTSGMLTMYVWNIIPVGKKLVLWNDKLKPMTKSFFAQLKCQMLMLNPRSSL
jgi:hypothetical protein